MNSSEVLHSLWPANDAPGVYEAACSCGSKVSGAADTVNTWGRTHDDAPFRKHIVSISHGGRRIDHPAVNG